MQAIVDAYDVWNRRIPTSGLQPLVRACRERASAARGFRDAHCGSTTLRKPRVVRPALSIFALSADAVPDAYKRYLLNSLRETFDLPGTPIRLDVARERDNPYKGRAKRKH